MTDPTKLSDWLPILQHPEVGERVCEAAGARLEKDSEGVAVTELWFPGYGGLAKSSVLFEWQISALAFGTLYAIGLKHYPEIVESGSEWKVHEKGYLAKDNHAVPWEATFPAAVLAAARRVWANPSPC